MKMIYSFKIIYYVYAYVSVKVNAHLSVVSNRNHKRVTNSVELDFR